MNKEELIEKLQAIEGNPEVKVFDHRKCMHDDCGDGSSEGIYDFDVELINNDLEEDEKQFIFERDGKNIQAFLGLVFDNPELEA